MPVAPVVHIGGWPGVGKMTIGRIVAEALDGRLIHNHLILDAARAIYERNTQECVAMREEVRDLLLGHARRLPKEVPIVFTDALADEPAAVPLFQPTLDFANDRNAPLHLFVLDADIEENQRRLQNSARFGGAKLTDSDILKTIRKSETLFIPKSAVVLDVTHMTAEAAAGVIVQRLEQSRG